MKLLNEEGVTFVTNAHVGKQEDFPVGHMTQIMEERGCQVKYIDPNKLLSEHDAVLLATGATKPRDLPIAGRELKGIHSAMEFLTRNTKSLLDSELDNAHISAKESESSSLAAAIREPTVSALRFVTAAQASSISNYLTSRQSSAKNNPLAPMAASFPC